MNDEQPDIVKLLSIELANQQGKVREPKCRVINQLVHAAEPHIAAKLACDWEPDRLRPGEIAWLGPEFPEDPLGRTGLRVCYLQVSPQQAENSRRTLA